MSLRFAILGFLSSTPSTGYRIAREFAIGAGSFWSALPSQIYPELRALEKAGLIEGEQDESNRLGRRIFHLTEAGEAALREWVDSPVEYPPERDAERVRLLFLDLDPAALKRHLERHREHHRERLARWRELLASVMSGRHPQLQARLAVRPPAEHAYMLWTKRLAIEGSIARAEQEIAWAEAALAELAREPHGLAAGPQGTGRQQEA
jgi:DNA-binding PadR family transcriptional regulator